MVPVPPCVVSGTMVVKLFGTTCEEVIARSTEKIFSGGTTCRGVRGHAPLEKF